MKRALSIFATLLVCAFAFSAHAVITEGPEEAHVFDSSSYDPLGLSAYLSTYFTANFPQNTNHWIEIGRGGQSIEGDAELTLFKWAAPSMSACTGSLQVLFFNNDNGGANYATTLIWNTNLCSFPGLVWNGSAYAPLAGWATTHSNQVSFFPSGAQPHDSTDGDGGEIARNQASLDFASGHGIPTVNTWGIWTNGVQVDQTNNRYFWDATLGGSHPTPAGCLCVTLNWLKQRGADSNVNSCTLDWNTGLRVSTNHCVVSGESRSGNSFSWTEHADRHSMAWDVPDASTGMTNDARNAFVIMPSLTNVFFEGFQITNAPDGNYNFSMDGHFDRVITGAELRSGANLFRDYTNNIWKQRAEMLGRTRDQNGQNRTNLVEHSAGNSGTAGTQDAVNLRSNENQQYDNNGLRGDAMIASVASIVSSVRGYDALLNQSAQPTNHTYSLVFIQPVKHPRIRK